MAGNNKGNKPKKLFQVLRELNLKQDTVVAHLKNEGFELGKVDVNTKLNDEMYLSLLEKFAKEKAAAERHKRWAEEERLRKEQRDLEDNEDETEVAPASVSPTTEAESVQVVAEVVTSEPAPIELPPEPVAVTAPPEQAPEKSEVVEERATEPQPVFVAPEPEPEPEPPHQATPETEVVQEAAPEPTVVETPAIPEPQPPSHEIAATEPEETFDPALLEAEAERLDPVGIELEAVIAPLLDAVATEDVLATDLPPRKKKDKPKKPDHLREVEELDIDENGPKLIKSDRYILEGPKVLGRVNLATLQDAEPGAKRKKRKRKGKTDEPLKPVKPVTSGHVATGDGPKKPTTHVATTSSANAPTKAKKKKAKLPVVSQEEVKEAILQTKTGMQRQGTKERQGARLRRREKRVERAEIREQELAAQEAFERKLRVVEYVSANELANMMDVSVTEIISTCLELGLMVSINQRLEADTIQLIAEEFGVEIEFVTDVASDEIALQDDDEQDLLPRAPVVTIMGHVDHGKTSLLDYIRRTNVVKSEAGGITQHIGAYSVTLPTGQMISFLDTPGHEAFTAMRARGAQVTDIVVLVVAADDGVMPQTIEAINHAHAAGVPLIIAVNKIDKDGANPQRVMQELTQYNVVVEAYGGNVQHSEISAKQGTNIDGLLQQIVDEAELLDLKANPNRNADGTIVESRIDKGRGIVATVLVQRGTLKVGDVFVAGAFTGKVRAMFDETEKRIKSAGPSKPALIVGFNGPPDVGDRFVVLDDEREAKEIANKRQQIAREQSMRQKKHLTLDEIGRRLALGDFKELNLIIKADVGGSVQALTDSLLKLSTEEVQVRIIHSAVGAVTESDVLLASTSDAVIIGFQVRPASPQVRRVLEQEQIDFRTYSVIYDAIEDVRDALEGLLSPELSDKTLGTAQVREVFHVPKVGSIAGCMVTEGKILRKDAVRLVRDGVVIWSGRMASLRRFKDPVNEVNTGYECGIGLEGGQDIKVGDLIETFEVVSTKRRLAAR